MLLALLLGVEGNIGGELGFFIELWRYACLQIKLSRFESRRQHCIVFLSKTLNSHSASLYAGALMGTGELNARVSL